MKCVLFGVATLFLAESHLIGKPSPFPLECESRSSASDDESFEEGSSESSRFSRFGYGWTVPGYRGRRYDYGNGYGNFYGNGDGNIVGIDFESDSDRSSENLQIDSDFGRRRSFDGIYDYRYPDSYGPPLRYSDTYPGSGSYYPINYDPESSSASSVESEQSSTGFQIRPLPVIRNVRQERDSSSCDS